MERSAADIISKMDAVSRLRPFFALGDDILVRKRLDSETVFAEMEPKHAVRYMAFPAIISQLIVLLYNLADTFFLGQINDPYMVAGVSLILPVFNITLALGSLVGIGGGVLVPKLLARFDKEEAERVLTFCLLLALLISAAFSVGLFALHSPLLRMLGAGENTFDFAWQYLFMVVVLGGVPTIMANVLANLIRSISYAREAGIGVALGGGLNIIFDPLLLYLMPKEQAVFAVGIATLVSNMISFAYLMWVLCKKQTELKLRWEWPRPTKASVRDVFVIGIPGAVGTLLFDIDYMILDRLMTGYGDIAMAGIGIVLKAERFPLQFGIGLCQGIVPLIAYCYARKDRQRLNSIIGYSCALGIAVSVVSIILYELAAPEIIRFFIRDEGTVELGAHFLRARSPATLFMFLCFSVVHIYQAFGRGGTALFLGVMRWAVFNFPMLFILNRFFGMYGLVWSQLTADVIAAIISWIMFITTLKKMERRFSE